MKKILVVIVVFFSITIFISCGGKDTPPGSPCAGVTINMNPSSLPLAELQTAYSVNITASGGNPPYTLSLESGTLPTGFQIIGSQSLIIGTATVSGTSNFKLKITDSKGCTASKEYSIVVPNVDASNVSYNNFIKALLNNKCQSCHQSGGNGAASWNYDGTYANAFAKRNSIKQRCVDGVPSWMPTAGPLPLSERNLIAAWVNRGAPEF